MKNFKNLKTFEEFTPFIPGHPGNFGEDIILDDLTIGETSDFLDTIKDKTISFTSKGKNKIEKVKEIEIDCGGDYPGKDAPTSYCKIYINDFKVDQGRNIKIVD